MSKRIESSITLTKKDSFLENISSGDFCYLSDQYLDARSENY